MAIDPVTAGIDLVSTIIRKAADRFLPASMSEAEKQTFVIEARKLAMEEGDQFVQFIKATEPDAQYVGKWINGLRASVRPGVAWLAFLTYQGMMIWLTYVGKMSVTEFVAQAGALSTMAIGFYFGHRSKSD